MSIPFGDDMLTAVHSPSKTPHHSCPAPSSKSLDEVLLKPPFCWKSVPLRAFRCPSTLSAFAPDEEKRRFLNAFHRQGYKFLTSNLVKDLKALKRHHKLERTLQETQQSTVAQVEAKEFHEEFTKRLEWGHESSPLLIEAECEEEGVIIENPAFTAAAAAAAAAAAEGTEFESIRMYFAFYPKLSISWAVQDFYKRQDSKFRETVNALAFQQLWEWCERHWNFFEALSKLRDVAKGQNAKIDPMQTPPESELGSSGGGEAPPQWSPEVESRKRRHQWAVLKKIMKAFEANGEDFPHVRAPAGESLERYFGKYGYSEAWYPEDVAQNISEGETSTQQMDSVESVLEAGGTLAQACMADIVKNQVERVAGPRTDAYSVLEPVAESTEQSGAGAADGTNDHEIAVSDDDSQSSVATTTMTVETKSFLTSLLSKRLGIRRGTPSSLAVTAVTSSPASSPPSSSSSSSSLSIATRSMKILKTDRTHWCDSWRNHRAAWPGGLHA